jgi:hypothetical protein
VSRVWVWEGDCTSSHRGPVEQPMGNSMGKLVAVRLLLLPAGQT